MNDLETPLTAAKEDGSAESVDEPDKVEELEGEGEDEPEEMHKSLEHYRLSGRPPLHTVFALSSGPFLAQVTGALKGIISTIWISMALGEVALAAISTIGVYDGISRAFGFFLSASGASKISQLYGQHREDEASQVVVDIIRIALIFGVVVPSILGPTVRPLCIWFGANSEVVELSKEYMLPINVMTFSTCLFIGLGGCMQGEGRSFFFSMLNIASLILGMAGIDPLLLLAFKTGIWGASCGQAFSEFVPAFIIFIMYFMGKFGVKPKFAQFIKPFSPHTLPSLKVGISQFIANVSQTIPSILVRKLMGDALGDRYNDGMAGFNTEIRFMIITNAVIIAVTNGFLPAASYAIASKQYKRWFWLCFHCIWITFVWGSFTSVLTWTIPRELSKMFGKSEGYLEMSGEMVKIGNALGFVVFGRFCGVSFLQSMQKGMLASILSITAHFFSIIIFSLVLYYTDKHDGVRILWCYALAHAFGFVTAIIALAKPVYDIYKEMRWMETEDTSDPENTAELHKDECTALDSHEDAAKNEAQEKPEVNGKLTKVEI